MGLAPITYKFNNQEEARALTTLTDQKLAALEKYCEPGQATCEVEFDKIQSHQSGRLYRVEAMLTIAGVVFRAEATEDSFEKAIDEVRDELDKELRRAKDKQHTRDKDAGREFKDRLTSD